MRTSEMLWCVHLLSLQPTTPPLLGFLTVSVTTALCCHVCCVPFMLDLRALLRSKHLSSKLFRLVLCSDMLKLATQNSHKSGESFLQVRVLPSDML
jgi:hypothetical protein